MKTEREKLAALKVRKSITNKKWFASLPLDKKKQRCDNNKKYFIKYPWLKSFYAARQRVFGGNPKHHLYKGLEFSISKKYVMEIWTRDRAYNMECPSIDRIDSKIGYTENNCRFMENRLNTGRHLRESDRCINGHEYTKNNTWINKYGHRRCRTCLRRADEKYKLSIKSRGLICPA